MKSGKLYGVIKNEYGKEVSPQFMLEVITLRGTGECLSVSDQFLKDNNAEIGPFGLLRRKIDGVHVLAHDAGTWDITRGLS